MVMYKPNRDQEIISAIKEGRDSVALNDLYKNTLPSIIKFISKNGGDRDEAKDIFQDAVVALFMTIKLGKFDESRDVDGFVYFVSRNLWINRIKKKKRGFSIDLIQLSPQEEGTLSVMITDEKKKAIDALMDKIGSKCKELLRYSLYENLSMREIAAKMGFAAETVAKTTHYRCKQKLIEIIENDRQLFDLFRG